MPLDPNRHILQQVDRHTKTTWKDLTPEEQVRMYREVLGRDPSREEINWQIKNGGSIKYFIHGAKGELEARAQQGDEPARRMNQNIGGWEDSIKASKLEKWTGWTGIKEISDPFGELAELTGIKELASWGPSLLGFVNPAAGIAATSINSAARSSEWGDVFKDTAFALGGHYLKTPTARAALAGGRVAVEGGDVEDMLKAAGVKYVAGAADAKYKDVVPLISNRAVIEASYQYATTQNIKSAATIVAFDAGGRQVNRMRGNPYHDRTHKDSFREWAKRDAAQTMDQVKAVPGQFKKDTVGRIQTGYNSMSDRAKAIVNKGYLRRKPATSEQIPTPKPGDPEVSAWYHHIIRIITDGPPGSRTRKPSRKYQDDVGIRGYAPELGVEYNV